MAIDNRSVREHVRARICRITKRLDARGCWVDCTRRRSGRSMRVVRTKPIRIRWLDLHNLFWELRMNQRLLTNTHLTTWTGFTKEAILEVTRKPS